MKKYLLALMMLGVCLTVAIPASAQPLAQSTTQTAPAVSKKSVKPSAKKAPAKKAKPAREADDDGEPDITGSASDDYQCELGNKLTIYHNATDDRHIALRWNKQLVRLTRVGTSTGANRFENRKSGLVWIDIPAKGMLLDSKKGRQLANECKTSEQMAPTKPAVPSPAEPATPQAPKS